MTSTNPVVRTACLGLALLTALAATAAPATPRAKARKPPPVAAPAVPDIELAPAQLAAADRVMLGAVACEYGQTLRITAVPLKPGHFVLAYRKAVYRLVPQETTTGAVRLEDRTAGVVWLQIPSKSMLLNARTGQRMVDSCQHDDQRQVIVAAENAIGIVDRPAAPQADPPALALAPEPGPQAWPCSTPADPPAMHCSVAGWEAWLAPSPEPVVVDNN